MDVQAAPRYSRVISGWLPEPVSPARKTEWQHGTCTPEHHATRACWNWLISPLACASRSLSANANRSSWAHRTENDLINPSKGQESGRLQHCHSALCRTLAYRLTVLQSRHRRNHRHCVRRITSYAGADPSGVPRWPDHENPASWRLPAMEAINLTRREEGRSRNIWWNVGEGAKVIVTGSTGSGAFAAYHQRHLTIRVAGIKRRGAAP